MNCHEAERRLFAERDGVLEPSQRAELLAHVSECESCRRTRENLTIAIDEWRADAQSVRVPSADLEWQKIRRELRRPAGAGHRPLLAWIALPVAAAAAVAVGLYISPGSPGSRMPTLPTDAATQPATVAAALPAAGASQTASTVVYVDDKSGWTFVWAPDSGSGQHI